MSEYLKKHDYFQNTDQKTFLIKCLDFHTMASTHQVFRGTVVEVKFIFMNL
jgi:hypothetical protein